MSVALERREELEALERAGQTEASPAVGAHVGDVRAVQAHRAPVGALQPGNDVEQRGLAGAVGADQARHHPRLGAQRHVGERGDAAEVDAHVVDPEGG